MNRFQFEKPSLTQKKELNRLKNKMFLICFLPVLFITWNMYINDLSKYELLKDRGVKTEAISEFIPGGNYKYFFITPEVVRIDKQGKCSSLEKYNSFYEYLQVIYDPQEPSVYMEYPYFKNYSIVFKIFFFLIITLIIDSFISSIIATIIWLSRDGNELGFGKIFRGLKEKQ